MAIVLFEGSDIISIQPFNILILDNSTGGADSLLGLIQELNRLIENMSEELNQVVKLSEKGQPNGVASLDEEGKIHLEQMPKEFQVFLDHIPQTVYEHRVHGFGVDEDGLGIYRTPSGEWQYIGFSPDAKGEVYLLAATIKVVNGVATVTYEGIPTLVSNKWSIGDRAKEYFLLNGSAFGGATFNVSVVGSHTLYYKDSNDTEYVKIFEVTQAMLTPEQTDFSPPKIQVFTNGWFPDGKVKVGRVTTTAYITDQGGSGFSHVLLPDGTRSESSDSANMDIESNNTYVWKAYDKAGNEGTHSMVVNNIGTPVNIYNQPIGARFFIFQDEYVLIEKDSTSALIALYDANSIVYTTETGFGSTNLFDGSYVKIRGNNTSAQDTTNQNANIIRDYKWNYGYGTNPTNTSVTIGSPTYSTGESRIGLLNINQLKNAVDSGLLKLTDEGFSGEWSITPSNDGTVFGLNRDGDITTLTTNEKATARPTFRVNKSATAYI